MSPAQAPPDETTDATALWHIGSLVLLRSGKEMQVAGHEVTSKGLRLHLQEPYTLTPRTTTISASFVTKKEPTP